MLKILLISLFFISSLLSKNICGDFHLLDSVIINSKLYKPLKYSKELPAKNFIIYAQPNLEQKRIKAAFKTQNIVNNIVNKDEVVFG